MSETEEVVVIHINDEVDTKPETILQDGIRFYWIYIHNVSTNTLYISFDGGTTWKQIASNGTIELTAPQGKKIKLSDPLKGKGSGKDTKFEALLLVDHSDSMRIR